MIRVPFGTSARPFLLTATIMHHLTSVSDHLTQTATRTKTSFYVDDLLLGAHSLGEASRLYNEANEIMLNAVMRLRKWVSNSDELQDVFDNK